MKRRGKQMVAIAVTCVLLSIGAYIAVRSIFHAAKKGELVIAAAFKESGVIVNASVTGWDGSRGVITATFTPEEEGFHLYSTDLPAAGVDGVGRPTTVELHGALAAVSKPTASVATELLRLPEIDEPVPVYPVGPVTITAPITAERHGRATILFTYAACSETDGCMLPVERKPVELEVTGEGVAFVASADVS